MLSMVDALKLLKVDLFKKILYNINVRNVKKET